MLVLQITLAGSMLIGLLVVADRFCARWAEDDALALAERRHARHPRRRRVQSPRATRPAPDPEPPPRRPIQVVAADLRRLARQLALVPSGSTLVRWKAMWAAYDGVLVEAAEMLEVHQEIGAHPPGLALDIERVRVLAALEDAGLTVHA
jgi:hypothetical protein